MNGAKVEIAEDLILDFSGLFDAGKPAKQGKEKPLEGATAPPKDARLQLEEVCAHTAKSGPGREVEPHTAIKARRDYKAIYRAVFEFHERHKQPDGGQDYWTETAEDMNDTAQHFDNDPFLIGLLLAIYEELEREYRAFSESL